MISILHEIMVNAWRPAPYEGNARVIAPPWNIDPTLERFPVTRDRPEFPYFVPRQAV